MKKVFVIMLALMMVVLASCTPQLQDGYKTITPSSVKKLLDDGTAVTLVDARNADEYQQGHIPSAILVPNESIGETKPTQLPDLNATIIVYCQSGNRSKTASEKLLQLGYTNVQDMGGINSWPYATVTGSEPGVWTVEPGEEDPKDDNSPALSEGILGEFVATTIYGDEVNHTIVADYQLTMVNVWATFCGPCINEMPALGELAEFYKDKGVQIVGVVADVFNADGTLDQSQIELAKDIVDKTGAKYTHLVPSDDIKALLSLSEYVPTTIFVDKDGNQVGEIYIGAKSKNQWNIIIKQLLEEVSQ